MTRHTTNLIITLAFAIPTSTLIGLTIVLLIGMVRSNPISAIPLIPLFLILGSIYRDTIKEFKR